MMASLISTEFSGGRLLKKLTLLMTKFLGLIFRFTLRRFGLVASALLLFETRLKGNVLFNIIKLHPTPQNGIYLGHGQVQTGDSLKMCLRQNGIPI